jgi:hypothetical protein
MITVEKQKTSLTEVLRWLRNRQKVERFFGAKKSPVPKSASSFETLIPESKQILIESKVFE